MRGPILSDVSVSESTMKLEVVVLQCVSGRSTGYT